SNRPLIFGLFLGLMLASASVATAASPASSITVGVTTATGIVVHPYIAVVSDDQPWRNPLREEVLTNGTSAIWAVPPGRYRVVGGAHGFATAYGHPIEVP